jgi:hypothetical protein
MAKNFELQSLCKKRSKEAKPKNEMRWCAGALVRWCAGALVRSIKKEELVTKNI